VLSGTPYPYTWVIHLSGKPIAIIHDALLNISPKNSLEDSEVKK